MAAGVVKFLSEAMRESQPLQNRIACAGAGWRKIRTTPGADSAQQVNARKLLVKLAKKDWQETWIEV
jgi:hypothetical protein